MGFCKETSKKYLMLVNGLMAVMGVALLGLGVYAIIEYKDVLEDVGPLAQYVPVGAGGAVLFAALLGCYGTYTKSKPMLIVYFVALFAATTVVLAIGASLLVYLGYAGDAADASGTGVDVSSAVQKINDYQLAVFTTCCNSTVPVCTDIVTAGCAFDLELVETTDIPEGLCNTLEQVKIQGVSVVGGLTCSSPVIFQAAFDEYLQENILPIGITFIVLAVVLVFANLFTCVLICSNRYDYDAAYRAKVQQQEGGALTGTGQSNVKYV